MLNIPQDTFQEPTGIAHRDEPLVVHQHGGLSASENLVVFVHGLGGRRYGERSTWGHFPALLFADLPKVDVGLYSYVSLLGRARFWRSVALEDEAQVLAGIIVQASTYKRVILVGHSMGGLICKAAVKHLVESGDFPHPPHVSGLIMMATPQAGSMRVPWLARHFTTDGRALAAHGRLVTQLNTFFTTRLVLDGSPPTAGREALPTWAVLGASDIWVDTLSASLGLALNRTRRVRGSHSAIVKPATRDADAFRFVADCVSRLVEPSGPRLSAELPTRDPAPAVGVFFDRLELRSDLREFVTNPRQRLFVLAAPPGWGKRNLAAVTVAEHRDLFEDVLWVDCTDARATASAFLGQLHAMLRDNGDTAMEAVWHNVSADGLPRVFTSLVAALNRKRYLVVLHQVERWLDADDLIADPALRSILLRLLAAANKAKIVVTSTVLPRFDPSGLEVPIGVIVERTVAGLDEAAAVELLRASGLRTLDEALLTRVTRQYSGMPIALRIFADLVNRAHRDPASVLRSTEVEEMLDALLMQSLAALPPDAREVVDRFAVFRGPIPRARLDTEPLIPMLSQRFVVEVDKASGIVRVAEPVRRAVLGAMTADTSRRLHRLAADSFAGPSRAVRPVDLADAEAALEEAFHRVAAGDVPTAADALWWAGSSLLTWGYVDVVEHEARSVYAVADQDTARARTAFLLGEVADLKGSYDEADQRFRESLRLSTTADIWSLATCSQYRLGRIAASRSRFGEAEEHFSNCIETCQRHDVTDGWAGALLSLGWVERQRGATGTQVKGRLDQALAKARETGDAQIEASAHRELGYLAWTLSGDEKECRRHLEQARAISESHNEIKELGAVHTTLGFLETKWGDTRGAIQNSWEAVRIAKSIGDNHMLASAYDHLGQAWEQRGDLVAAEEWYRRGGAEEAQIDNPSGRAVTHLHLGRVRRKQGRRVEATEDLATARRLVVSYGITELLPRVEEEEQALKL